MKCLLLVERADTQLNWPISLLDKIADLETVIAIKDAKDDEYSYELIDSLKEKTFHCDIRGRQKTMV